MNPMKRCSLVLALSIVSMMFSSGCAVIQRVDEMNAHKRSWAKVVKDDPAESSGFKCVKINMQEMPAFKQFVEANGLPDYVFVKNVDNLKLLYLKKDKVYSWHLDYTEQKIEQIESLANGCSDADLAMMPEVEAYLKNRKRLAKETEEQKEESRQLADKKEQQESERKEKEKRLALEQKQQDYDNKLKSDPQFCYNELVKDKYGISKGMLVEPRILRGKVSQVVDKNRIILELGSTGNEMDATEQDLAQALKDLQGALKGSTDGMKGTVAVVLDSTDNLVDNQKVKLVNYAKTGTFKYTAVTGAGRTIAEYTQTKLATYAEFLELWKAGKVTIGTTKRE